MKRQHLCMMAVSLIMAICMCLGLAACDTGSTGNTHTHSYTYTDNEDGTHNGTCTADGDCDAKNITKQPHTYGDNDECVCGAKKPTTPPTPTHEHSYTYTDNKDGTHNGTCTADGDCDAKNITNEKHTLVNGVCSKCNAKEESGGEKPVLAANEVMFDFDGVITASSTNAYTAEEIEAVLNSAKGDKEIAFSVTDATYVFAGNDKELGLIKLGNSSKTGSVTLTFTDKLITKVVITAKAFTGNQVEPSAIKVNDSNAQALTTDAAEYTFVLDEATDVITITGASTNGNRARSLVYSIIVTTSNTALAKPVVTIDDNGVATWDEVANADSYTYTINGGAAKTATERRVQLEDGDTIVVTAINRNGDYDSRVSDEKTYTKIKLDTPTVTATGTGVKWTAVANASGYGYEITPAEGEKKTGTTEKTSIALDNGDTIKVWATGTGKYKDSDPSAPVTYAYKEVQIDEPTFTIARDGTVTIAEHHDTTTFKYVIGVENDLYTAYDNGTLGENAQTVNGAIKLTSGQAIALIAVGNGTNLKDSDWTISDEYYAPAGAFDAIDADDVLIDLSDGKVYVVWEYGEADTTYNYEIMVDGVATTLNDFATTLDFKSYNEIKIKVLATTEPAEGSYDYSECHDDSEYLDITEAVNAFVAEEEIKIAAGKIAVEKDALELVEKVTENKEITLPATGATYSEVAITWAVEGGNNDIASIENGKLTITPTKNETDVTIVATLTCGDAEPVEIELTIAVKLIETVKDTFTFTSTTTLANVEGNYGSLAFAQNSGNNSPTWNNGDKAIRTYSKNTITIKGNGKIVKIELTYIKNASSGNVPSINDPAYVETQAETGYLGTWTGYADEVTLTLAGSAGNLAIKSIVVTYEKPTDDSIVNAALKAMESFEFAEKYTKDFTVDAAVNGLDISWSATTTVGDGSISFNGNAATVTRGTTESTVTITASVTSGEVTKTKTWTVTVAADNGDPVEKAWTKVTNLDQLDDDVEIIIVSSDGKFAMGGFTGTNTYANNVAITATNGMTDIPDGVVRYTIKKGTDAGKFAIMSDGSYLQATAAKSIKMADASYYWTISINTSGVATITAATTSHGSLKYNTSAPRFTTYTSGQTTLSIYALI